MGLAIAQEQGCFIRENERAVAWENEIIDKQSVTDWVQAENMQHRAKPKLVKNCKIPKLDLCVAFAWR